MQMVAGSQPGLAAARDHLAAFYVLPLFHIERVQVGVKALQAAAVVDHHNIAEDTEKPCINHRAIVGGQHRGVLHNRKIKTQVGLVVDCLAVVDIGSEVRKRSFDFRVTELHEGLVPGEVGGGFLGESHQLLRVHAPQRAVDQQEILQKAALIR